jgi:hypothetical protein
MLSRLCTNVCIFGKFHNFPSLPWSSDTLLDRWIYCKKGYHNQQTSCIKGIEITVFILSFTVQKSFSSHWHAVRVCSIWASNNRYKSTTVKLHMQQRRAQPSSLDLGITLYATKIISWDDMKDNGRNLKRSSTPLIYL